MYLHHRHIPHERVHGPAAHHSPHGAPPHGPAAPHHGPHRPTRPHDRTPHHATWPRPRPMPWLCPCDKCPQCQIKSASLTPSKFHFAESRHGWAYAPPISDVLHAAEHMRSRNPLFTDPPPALRERVSGEHSLYVVKCRALHVNDAESVYELCSPGFRSSWGPWA